MTRERRYLIWSVEHDAWWAPGELGYVRSVADAGEYPEARARAIVLRANIAAFHECMIPVECLTATADK